MISYLCGLDKSLILTKNIDETSIVSVYHISDIKYTINENDDNMQTTISVKIEGHEMRFDAETTEDVLIKFAKKLPVGWNIKSCLSCRYGHFCPVGNADNELFCVTEFEPKEISDLWQVTEDDAERNKRSRNLFHLCEQYLPQASDYLTYSDYLSEVNHH